VGEVLLGEFVEDGVLYDSFFDMELDNLPQSIDYLLRILRMSLQDSLETLGLRGESETLVLKSVELREEAGLLVGIRYRVVYVFDDIGGVLKKEGGRRGVRGATRPPQAGESSVLCCAVRA